MAIILTETTPVADHVQPALVFLAAGLPNAYILLPTLPLAGIPAATIDLLLVGPHGMVALSVSASDAGVTPALLDDADTLRARLAAACRPFYSGPLSAALVFTDPAADLPLEEPADIRLLTLDKASLRRLTEAPHAHNAPSLTAAQCFQFAGRLREGLPTNDTPLHTSFAAPTGRQPARLRPKPTPTAAPERFVHIAADEPTVAPAAPHPTPHAPSVVQRGRRLLLNALNGFERQAESIVEPRDGGRIISQYRLAQLLEHEMEETLHHMINQTIARNRYTVQMAPADYALYAPLRAHGEAELVSYLQQIAAARDYTVHGPLSVSAVSADEVPPGQPRVTSAIDGPGSVAAAATLQLVGNKQQFILSEQTTTVGRSHTCTVCLAGADRQRVVSRKHARIERAGAQFVLYDGDGQQPSRGGTFVNGEPVAATGTALRDGDEIVLGPTQRLNSREPLAGSLQLRFHQQGGSAQ